MSLYTIRRATTYDAAGMARVNVESWRATYQGIVHEEFLQNLSVENRTEFWKNIVGQQHPQKIYVVAVDTSNTVIGYATGGVSRESEFDSELYALYLLPAWQGYGIGKELVEQIFTFCKTQNMLTICVWVLKDNPSRTFYEAIGGTCKASKLVTIGNQHLEEWLYVWKLR